MLRPADSATEVVRGRVKRAGASKRARSTQTLPETKANAENAGDRRARIGAGRRAAKLEAWTRSFSHSGALVIGGALVLASGALAFFLDAGTPRGPAIFVAVMVFGLGVAFMLFGVLGRFVASFRSFGLGGQVIRGPAAVPFVVLFCYQGFVGKGTTATAAGAEGAGVENVGGGPGVQSTPSGQPSGVELRCRAPTPLRAHGSGTIMTATLPTDAKQLCFESGKRAIPAALASPPSECVWLESSLAGDEQYQSGNSVLVWSRASSASRPAESPNCQVWCCD